MNEKVTREESKRRKNAVIIILNMIWRIRRMLNVAVAATVLAATQEKCVRFDSHFWWLNENGFCLPLKLLYSMRRPAVRCTCSVFVSFFLFTFGSFDAFQLSNLIDLLTAKRREMQSCKSTWLLSDAQMMMPMLFARQQNDRENIFDASLLCVALKDENWFLVFNWSEKGFAFSVVGIQPVFTTEFLSFTLSNWSLCSAAKRIGAKWKKSNSFFVLLFSFLFLWSQNELKNNIAVDRANSRNSQRIQWGGRRWI